MDDEKIGKVKFYIEKISNHIDEIGKINSNIIPTLCETRLNYFEKVGLSAVSDEIKKQYEELSEDIVMIENVLFHD